MIAMARLVVLSAAVLILSSCSTIRVELEEVDRKLETHREARLIDRLFDGIDLRAVNSRAVSDVQEGLRAAVSAAWWGFSAENATPALQAAIDSGAKFVLVPYMEGPWLIDPVDLASDQTVFFEEGVVVEARAGSFLGRGDNLFTIQNKENITLRGYGATLKMRRTDYRKAPYRSSQHRHCLDILGGKNIRIYGLTITESGGDGIYIGRGDNLQHCSKIHIKDVVLSRHHRQAVSVISVEDLLIEDSKLMHTRGHQPQAGIDFEPNQNHERLVRCVVRRCEISHNAGQGVLIVLGNLDSKSKPVSISVESCIIKRNSIFSVVVLTYGKKLDGQIYFAGNDRSGLSIVPPTGDLKVEFMRKPDPDVTLVPVNLADSR